jgi:hypothetical protein
MARMAAFQTGQTKAEACLALGPEASIGPAQKISHQSIEETCYRNLFWWQSSMTTAEVKLVTGSLAAGGPHT